MSNPNIIGARFGRWTVLERGADYINPASGSRIRRWLCLCDCGNRSSVVEPGLLQKKSQSCGCWGREKRVAAGIKANTTHGMGSILRRSPEYQIWAHMLKRCRNPRDAAHPNYGGRGITVCKRWENFENFFTDMGERPAGLWLDRKNNNLGYSKANCRWATPCQQANNKRSNRMISLNGKTLTVSQWALRLKVSRGLIYNRLAAGWSGRDALKIPVFGRSAR